MRRSKGRWVCSKRDVWSLDNTLNPIILAGLLKFKEELLKSEYSGVPADFCTGDEVTDECVAVWHKTIDNMILAFDDSQIPDIRDYDFKINLERIPTDREGYTQVITSCTNEIEQQRYYKDCREHEEKCKQGRELFSRYYQSLWL
jgi:hypothetical protein